MLKRLIPLDQNPKTINDRGMNNKISKYPKHACQSCGSEGKLVETLIDDEFVWNDVDKTYEPNKFMNEFEHTGNVRCAECDSEWSGE